MNYTSRLATGVALCCLLSVALSPPPDTRAALRAVTVDDTSAIRSVSGPRISPDGEWVAYSVTEIDVAADLPGVGSLLR